MDGSRISLVPGAMGLHLVFTTLEALMNVALEAKEWIATQP